MNIIKITTDNEIFTLPFPGGNIEEQNEAIYKLIGNTCASMEHIMPKRLYTELGAPRETGHAASMLVDEEGLLKELDINMAASYLYGTDHHGNPIVGNALIVGEHYDEDGELAFCGLSEEIYNKLYPQLEILVKGAKE